MENERGRGGAYMIVVFLLVSVVFMTIAFSLVEISAKTAEGYYLFKLLCYFSSVSFIFVSGVMAVFFIRKIEANHIDRIPSGIYRFLNKEFGSTMEVDKKEYYSLTLVPLDKKGTIIQVMVPKEALQVDKFTEYLIVERKRNGNIVLNTTESFLREEKRYNTPVMKPAI